MKNNYDNSHNGSISHNNDDDAQINPKKTRTTSFSMSKSNMWILVVNNNGNETLFEQTYFDLIKPLGSGAQGKVYAARVLFENDNHEIEERHCVLKHITKRRRSTTPFSTHETISANDQSSLENNIIKLIKVIQDKDGEDYALLPYCNLFLDNVITALNTMALNDFARFRDLATPLAMHVLFDLCNAYISMHLDKNHVHADVKPANVGFYCGHWCLIDMDCAKTVGAAVKEFSGTIAFSHPSTIRDRDNTSLPWSDLFALGEILHLLFHPAEYGIHTNKELMEQKDAAYRAALQKKYTENNAAANQVSLTQLIQAVSTAEDKIKIIAARLKEPLATDQADLLELRDCVHYLQNTLRFGSDTQQMLVAFYDELRSPGYFGTNSVDPLADSSIFSKSISEISFLSDSTRRFSESTRKTSTDGAASTSSSRKSVDLTDSTYDKNDKDDNNNGSINNTP